MFEVRQVRGGSAELVVDRIAIEEPLEIRIVFDEDGKKRDRSISITMRTPGADAKLAVGFLVTEGIVRERDDVVAVRPCRSGSVVRVRLHERLPVDLKRLQRHFFTSSSCGVCGKASIEAVAVQLRSPLQTALPHVAGDLIGRLPARLREAQRLFEQTGGLHASGLFDTTGRLLAIEEDVGRHNALDKLIGGQWMADASRFAQSIVVVSGRLSFELVQKALVVGVPIMVAVGAPSSLAVELAQRHGMTLLGFTKSDRYNVYHDAGRILAT
ncbi:MAG: formate dehydrogenase accessory sulfurtransferase FdhD [Novipirellula sp. JB048]